MNVASSSTARRTNIEKPPVHDRHDIAGNNDDPLITVNGHGHDDRTE